MARFSLGFQMILTIGWIILQVIFGTYAIVGYDCGTHIKDLKTVSLLEVGECAKFEIPVNKTEKQIQLIQLTDYTTTHVYQCKVEIRRTIIHCGMHSHISFVANGEVTYLEDVSRGDCLRMHDRKYHHSHLGVEIVGLTRNSTTRRVLDVAGRVDNEGNCKGTTYSDHYGTWDDVFVKGHITVTLRDYEATVNLEANKIHLQSGTVCKLTELECIDFEGGPTFWDSVPEDNECKFAKYGLLYSGMAEKMFENNTENPHIVYTLTSEDTTFALSTAEHMELCGVKLIRTEHPRLFITEQLTPAFVPIQKKSIQNLDIFAYVNSKFIYVEKHIKLQLERLYIDVITQRCLLEQQVLQNSLSIATQSPDEFAFRLMHGSGYMASVSGEVVHIVRCLPVEVQMRKTEECYLQLPVTHGERQVYLSPRTHIIMNHGVPTTCNALMPPMYYLGETWYKLLPSPVISMEPDVLRPLTKQTWAYKNPISLSTSGIYTSADLAKLRDHIMFPVERPAVLNEVARVMLGQPIGKSKISLLQFLDENALNRIVESTFSKTWGRFISFGTASAGIIGIVVIFRGIKLIIDTIIHGYALHTVYAWSVHLFGAIWDSVTHLLLHLAGKSGRNNKPDPPPGSGNENIEMNSVVSLAPQRLYPEFEFPIPAYEPRTLNNTHQIPEPHYKSPRSMEPHYKVPRSLGTPNASTTTTESNLTTITPSNSIVTPSTRTIT